MCGIQMKKNVGQLSVGGLFAGIVICLGIGIFLYSRFNFEQKVPLQDAAGIRLNDLEKKSIETQTKLDQRLNDLERKNSETQTQLSQVQEKLNQIQLKTTQAGPTKPDSTKQH
jgi:uncharacterized protein (DUF342 family)